MPQDPITVLLVEDDEDEALLMREALRDAGATDITLIHVDRLERALSSLARRHFDAVLLDLSLPDSVGIEGVAPAVEAAGDTPVIVCTGLNDESTGRDAIVDGAQDYLVKNPRLYGAIPRILRYAIERSRIIQSSKRKVDRARQYAELLLTKIISITNSGLGIADGEGNFIVVNPALAELVGRPVPDLLGTPWTNVLRKQDQARELRAYLDSLDRDVDYDRDRLTIQLRDGGTVDVPMRSMFVDFHEKHFCRVLSFGNPLPSDSSKGAAAKGGRSAKKSKFSVGETDTRVTADGLHVIGLETIKAEFGDRWLSVSERVFAMAERTIVRRLSPGDTWMRNHCGDFIIRFSRLSEEEGCFKAQAMSQEIREKFLGRDYEPETAEADSDPAT